MMTYTAPDGFVIQSKPNPEIVTYECSCSDISDGVFTSLETKGAGNDIGIQQIKIKRIVNNNFIRIEIQESSDAELIEYIKENTPPTLNF